MGRVATSTTTQSLYPQASLRALESLEQREVTLSNLCFSRFLWVWGMEQVLVCVFPYHHLYKINTKTVSR